MSAYNPPTHLNPLFDAVVFQKSNATDNAGIRQSEEATIGEIKTIASTQLPNSKWAWCDGSAFEPSLFPNLFAVIGYSYGQKTTPNPITSSSITSYQAGYTTPSLSTTVKTTTYSGYFQAGSMTLNKCEGGSVSVTIPLDYSLVLNYTRNLFGSVGSFNINTAITAVTAMVYKNGAPFSPASYIPTQANGGVDSITVTSGTVYFPPRYDYIISSTATTFMANYSFSFTPSVNTSGSDTYTYGLSLTLTTSLTNENNFSNITSLSTTNSIFINNSTYTLENIITSSEITYQVPAIFTTSQPTGWTANTMIFTPVTFSEFLLPDLRTRSQVGADSNTSLTTTYQGSSIYSGGSRTMTESQLPPHKHTSDGRYIGNDGNNNYWFIYTDQQGGNSQFPVWQYNNNQKTVTINSAGNNADLMPPFTVFNYIIRIAK
jgi:microcystin-dependent protein